MRLFVTQIGIFSSAGILLLKILSRVLLGLSSMNTNITGTVRKFLFLQGHPSTFARNLADELEFQGHQAFHINFCVGDALFWIGRKASNYRGKFENWEQYLRTFIKRNEITDIIYYGDRRPYHQIAALVAESNNIPTYV